LLIVEYFLLQMMEAILVVLGGHTGACLSVGDGLEESVGDATQHVIVDVCLGLEGGMNSARWEGHGGRRAKSRWKLDGILVWQFNGGVVGGDGRHWVDEFGAWWGRSDGKLSLIAVDVCKVKGFPVDVTEDNGRVV
jgi:hypothetical protein